MSSKPEHKHIIPAILSVLPLLYCFGLQSLGAGTPRDAGENVKFIPPGIIFSVVWTILFILVGVSWAIAYVISKGKRNEKAAVVLFYLLLTLLLGIWSFVYGALDKKTLASWLLILIIAIIFICMSTGNSVSRSMLAPLVAWCIFAMIMNTTEVQFTTTSPSSDDDEKCPRGAGFGDSGYNT